MLLKILAFVFLVPGFIIALAARGIVSRFNLDKNTKCEYETQMSEDELKQYKYNKAVVNLKMLGMIIALPGIVLILVVFR